MLHGAARQAPRSRRPAATGMPLPYMTVDTPPLIFTEGSVVHRSCSLGNPYSLAAGWRPIAANPDRPWTDDSSFVKRYLEAFLLVCRSPYCRVRVRRRQHYPRCHLSSFCHVSLSENRGV